MKKKIEETNTVGIILDWLWSLVVMGTTYYAVFFLGHSGWWFLFALILCTCTFPIKRTEIEESAT